MRQAHNIGDNLAGLTAIAIDLHLQAGGQGFKGTQVAFHLQLGDALLVGQVHLELFDLHQYRRFVVKLHQFALGVDLHILELFQAFHFGGRLFTLDLGIGQTFGAGDGDALFSHAYTRSLDFGFGQTGGRGFGAGGFGADLGSLGALLGGGRFGLGFH